MCYSRLPEYTEKAGFSISFFFGQALHVLMSLLLMATDKNITINLPDNHIRQIKTTYEQQDVFILPFSLKGRLELS